MARPVKLGRQVRVHVTPEHLAAIEREAVLTGATRSEVVRAALAAYLGAPTQRRSNP